MAIKNIAEQARNTKHLIGSSPEFTRTFRVELTAPVSASSIIVACGCTHGAPHPEFFAAKVYDVQLDESLIEDVVQPADNVEDENGSQPAIIEATVVAQYRVEEQPDLDLLPWQRADVWKFQTQGVAVPALYYFDNVTIKPLTNSAGDYFEGLTVDEAQQKITIQSNRQTFPSALASAVTNCVNDGAYLGFAADCVKVQGISGEIASEAVNGQEVRYWKITSELLARQSGWNLLLPDIGFNYLEGVFRRRATVRGPDGVDIPSANPVPLDGAGGMRAAGLLPEILTRRVYKRISMSTFFGTPPS